MTIKTGVFNYFSITAQHFMNIVSLVLFRVVTAVTKICHRFVWAFTEKIVILFINFFKVLLFHVFNAVTGLAVNLFAFVKRKSIRDRNIC